MEDVKKWMEQFAQLKEYSTKFAKITGEQMLRLKDDELSNVFAMESAVDRLYASYQFCGKAISFGFMIRGQVSAAAT